MTGPTSWLASALIVLTVVSGVHALTPLLAPGPWASVSTVLVLLVAAVAAALRHYGGTRSGPSLWGLATGVVLLAAVYSGQGSRPTVPMPTPDTLERLVRLGRSGILAISEGTVPLVPVRGVELLVVAGAVAAFLVADLLALTLGRAALSGLGLIALWVPAAVFERQPPFAAMLLAGTAFLLLLVVTRPQSRADGVGRDMAPALAAAAAVTVVAVVAGPVATVTPAFGSVRLAGGWGSGGGVGSGPLRVSTELDMRSSLADRSDRPILRYTTTSSELGPLRLYTVVEFDGAEWQRSDAAGPLTDGDGVLWPAEVPAEAETESVRVTVGDLDQDRLPIPINPRAIDIDGALRYDPERDEVLTSSGTSTRGAVYEMTVIPRALTADVLRADVAGTAVDPALLEVPESPHGADIRATVEEVVAGAATTYDQAIALQSYFRTGGTFRYSTEVPPAQTDDAVWDFLTQRTGYCVQYATAMTLMARMVGIPARLAVGFLPGRADAEAIGEYVVTGRQAHAWPELYFENAGWVRFEPTPAAQTGAPPAYADPFAGLPFTPEEQVGGSAAPQAATPAPAAPTAGAGDGRVSIGSAEVPVGVAVGATLVGLLALLSVLWWVHRRRRPVAVPEGPEAWWEALRVRLAEHGTTWSDAATVRQAALTIRERYAEEGLAAEESVQALECLVRAVESERYAPAPAIPSAAELEQWVDLVERPWLRTEPKELVGV